MLKRFMKPAMWLMIIGVSFAAGSLFTHTSQAGNSCNVRVKSYSDKFIEIEIPAPAEIKKFNRGQVNQAGRNTFECTIWYNQ